MARPGSDLSGWNLCKVVWGLGPVGKPDSESSGRNCCKLVSGQLGGLAASFLGGTCTRLSMVVWVAALEASLVLSISFSLYHSIYAALRFLGILAYLLGLIRGP